MGRYMSQAASFRSGSELGLEGGEGLIDVALGWGCGAKSQRPAPVSTPAPFLLLQI